MTDQNKAYLEQYMEQWHRLKYAGYIKHLDIPVRKELARIYNEELDPRAILDINCWDCVGQWLTVLYLNYEKQYGEIPNLLRPKTILNPNAFEPARSVPLSKAVEAVAPDPASRKKNRGKGRREP